MQRRIPWKMQRAPEVMDLMDIAIRTSFSVLTACCVQYVSECLSFYFWILHSVSDTIILSEMTELCQNRTVIPCHRIYIFAICPI